MATARREQQRSHGVCQVVQQHTRLHAALHSYRLLILIQYYGGALCSSSLCEPA